MNSMALQSYAGLRFQNQAGCPKRLRTSSERRSVHCHAASNVSNNEEYLKLADQLISDDPEAVKAVERVRIAEQKVAEVRAKQADLELAILEASLQPQGQVSTAQRDASLQVADAEVLAAQTLVLAAELQAKIIEDEKASMRAYLEQDAERKESGKAATVAAAGGLLGSVPLALTSSDEGLVLLATLLGSSATCALFGVVYRYVVRADSSNSHLVGGAVAAFGLARGMALAEATLRSAGSLDFEVFAQAALAAGESMLCVGFAAAALEAALGRGFVARFGAAAAPPEP